MLEYLMYRSELVPRRMAMLGLIGGPLLILSFVLQLFGVYANGSGASTLLALAEIAWEASLGIDAAWKGFRISSPLASSPIRLDVASPSSSQQTAAPAQLAQTAGAGRRRVQGPATRPERRMRVQRLRDETRRVVTISWCSATSPLWPSSPL
jgi:hypothetical protein